MVIMYVGNILSKHGYTPTNIETLGPQLESLGYSLIYASDKKNKLCRLIHMIAVLLKNRNKIDKLLIDQYSTFSFWYAVVVALICRFYSIPYYPILHGGNLPQRLIDNPKVCKQLFSHSAAIIAPSAYLKVKFEEFGYDVVHIPNNIPIASYEFTPRNCLRPKLLYVRSFDEVYNPIMAIEVLSKLRTCFPGAELCMVGPDKDGSLQRCVNRVVDLAIVDNVKFTGKLDKAQWHKLSLDYDIFINTTNFDNTPVSIIEAMALGLPVVSTNVGGIPYLLVNGEEALLVNKGDVEAMVAAIDSLLKNPVQAMHFAANARKKAESYGWDVVKDKWIGILG